MKKKKTKVVASEFVDTIAQREKALNQFLKKDLIGRLISLDGLSGKVVTLEKENATLIKQTKDFRESIKQKDERHRGNIESHKLEINNEKQKNGATLNTLKEQVKELTKQIKIMKLAEQQLMPKRRVVQLKADVYDKLVLKKVYESEIAKIDNHNAQREAEIIQLTEQQIKE